MGYDLFPHKSGLGLMEPVALIGHNVCVLYANDRHFRKVIWFEAIAPFEAVNCGAVAANTTSGRTQAVNLQFWRNEFGQLRWYPIDTVQARLFLPNADGRMNLRNLQISVDPTIVTRDPCGHLTEMFVWEDRNPAFEVINYTAQALVATRIIAYGFRFVTEELSAAVINRIKAGQEACVYVVASGFSGKP